MAITSYAELQTAMTNWLDRSDLSSRLPEFIVLFEAKINRKLRVRQQITTATLTVTAGSATLPTDYLEKKRLTWMGSQTRELDYVTPTFLSEVNQDSVSASPLYYTIEGSTIKVAPLDNTSLELLYAQKLPPLATTDPNWLLTSHPDGYLFGSLAMSATFTEDAQAGAAFGGLAQEILGELWGLDFQMRGTATMRTEGPTP